MHGNAFTWCQESYHRDYSSASRDRPASDKEDVGDILNINVRTLRGAGFNNHHTCARAAFRQESELTSRREPAGLRVARTCR
jgi:formylglycine-generating enzyme required for sulfatase activity